MSLYVYTEKEMEMLTAFYKTSTDCCGACDDEENMSYMNAQDLAEEMNLSLQAIGGIMASLLTKGAISDCMESYRKAKINDFVINDWQAVANDIAIKANRLEEG